MPKVSSVIVPYAAYLRVYEPLAAFPDEERAHWTRYARRPGRPSYQDELRRSLADLLPTPPVAVPVHESADAFVTEVDGVVCVCPWRTRLRGWQALGEVAEDFPEPVLDALIPPVVRRQSAQDYERWLERNPDARPWIRTATWQVPINWFVLVSDAEREYDEGGGDEAATAPVLRYRTPMVQARRRVARGCGPCGRPWTRGRSSTAWWMWGAGWRSSTRVPWSSWTTADWCTPCRPASWRRTTPRRTWPRGSRRCATATGLPRGRRTGGWWSAGGRSGTGARRTDV